MNFTDELDLARARKKARGTKAEMIALAKARARLMRTVTPELTFEEVIRALIDDSVRLGHDGVETQYENPTLPGWHVKITVQNRPFPEDA